MRDTSKRAFSKKPNVTAIHFQVRQKQTPQCVVTLQLSMDTEL